MPALQFPVFDNMSTLQQPIFSNTPALPGPHPTGCTHQSIKNPRSFFASLGIIIATYIFLRILAYLRSYLHFKYYPSHYYASQFRSLMLATKTVIRIGDETPFSVYQKDPMFSAREHIMACILYVGEMKTPGDLARISDIQEAKWRARVMVDALASEEGKRRRVPEIVVEDWDSVVTLGEECGCGERGEGCLRSRCEVL